MSDSPNVDRRDFLKQAGAAGVGIAMTNRLPGSAVRTSGSANEKVVVAVIGLNGRGAVHAENFARLKNSEVAYLCDVDSAVLGKSMSAERRRGVDRRSGPLAHRYVLYDLKQKVVKQDIEQAKGNSLDLSGDDAATSMHMENFLAGIRTGETLRAPIADAAKSVLLCHLGNISQYSGRKLKTDPTNGHVVSDSEAMKHWSRSYAPGWAPTV